MKKLIFLIAFSVVINSLLLAQEKKDKNKKPNILFILADDMGWSDLACYGNTLVETPHINRLAQQGMRFTNAYSSAPVCSPSRASIQTGQYPARIGMNTVQNPHSRPWAKLTPPKNRWDLPDNAQTLAEALNTAGYACTHLGKWHLGYEDHLPENEGYLPPSKDLNNLKESYRKAVVSFAQENPEKEIGHITQQAVKFMEEHQDDPFLCFVSYHNVHLPMQAKEPLVQKYTEKKKKQKQPTDMHPKYAAMVESADESVGLLMKALDDLKLSDNTIVIFFSDNGGVIQEYNENSGPIVTSNAPLRDEKGSLYEGGIREPLIVRWPGQVKAGTVNDVPVIGADFFPTIMEITGVGIKQTIDGISFLPLLSGNKNLNRETLYWHYPNYHHSTPSAAIRDGDYKLIEFYETGKLELYNLKKDMGELNDLASQYPEVAQKLKKKLNDWQKSVRAAMPVPNPNYNASKAYIWGVRPGKPWKERPLETLNK